MSDSNPGNDKDTLSDLVGKIIEYESGAMNEQQTVEFYCELFNAGYIPHLQGHYGRTWQGLYDAKLITIDTRTGNASPVDVDE